MNIDYQSVVWIVDENILFCCLTQSSKTNDSVEMDSDFTKTFIWGVKPGTNVVSKSDYVSCH